MTPHTKNAGMLEEIVKNSTIMVPTPDELKA